MRNLRPASSATPMDPERTLGYPPRRGVRSRFATALAALLLAACSGLPAAPPPAPEFAFAPSYRGSDDSAPYRALQWWRDFEDPALDRVVDAVLDANASLETAVARLEQARAVARIDRAPLFPFARPSLGAEDLDGPANAGFGAQLQALGLGADEFAGFGIAFPDRLGYPTYSVAAEFAWETDFWGRRRNVVHAAEANRAAAEADLVAARIGILAETVATWIEIAGLRQQRTLAGETIGILEQAERLASDRYDRGLDATGPQHVARRNLHTARANMPQLDAQLADAEGRLWRLLGGYRAELADMLPEAPPVPLAGIPVGVPADLLRQRPDVYAARLRLEAAGAELGARRAELLPSLSFAGVIGLTGAETGDWFDPSQWFRNLSANLLGPAFQGARLQAQTALARGRLDETAAAYRGAVVTAVNEVETALAGWQAGHRRHALLAAAAAAANNHARLQEQRYKAGLADLAEVLTSAQDRVLADSAVAAARRDLGLARLALHRALGGAWTERA